MSDSRKDLDDFVVTHADSKRLDAWSTASALWLSVVEAAGDARVLDLVEAFALYVSRCEADARWIFALPAGGDTQAVRARMDELGLAAHVDFVDRNDDGAMKAAMSCADALVASGASPALMRAMSIGVPIVSGASPDDAPLLEGAALIWEHFDPALIAASVERLRNDAALRQRLRALAFERISRIHGATPGAGA